MARVQIRSDILQNFRFLNTTLHISKFWDGNTVCYSAVCRLCHIIGIKRQITNNDINTMSMLAGNYVEKEKDIND